MRGVGFSTGVGKTLDTQASHRDNLVRGVVFAALLLGIMATRWESFLLFHTLCELFSIIVAFGIFVVAWNARRIMGNAYLLVLGIAYLFTGMVDLLHTLAYRGMGVFPNADADLATQLWIAARYIESVSFLAASLLMGRVVKSNWVLAVCALGTGCLLAAIFEGFFPTCYVEGSGLTAFKRVSEYAILVLLALSAGILLRQRRRFDPGVFGMILASIVLTMAAELVFTLYVGLEGHLNLVGHCLKVASYWLLYTAIIETGFKRPFETLFRDLKSSERELLHARDRLEERVRERTAELRRLARKLLHAQEEERRLLARELHDDFTQRLAALSIAAGKLEQECDAPAEAVREGLRKVHRGLGKLSEDIHVVSRQLHPSILHDLGLADALQSECDAFFKREGVPAKCEARDVPEKVPDEVSLCVFRVAQHALRNVAKHADASQVQVTVTVEDRMIVLEVRDNGVGFEPGRRGDRVGLGLVSMEERVALVGGEFTITSKPYGGTTVAARVPLGGERRE